MMRKCLTCNKEFNAPNGSIKKGYGKYCSSRCGGLGRWSNPTDKMICDLKKAQKLAIKSRIGSKHTEDTKKTISSSRRGKCLGKDNPKWVGKDVGYNALHSWISRKYGKPNTCERCGKTNLYGRNIAWANKSGNYLRKRDDWIRLCCKCHLNYDGYKRWEGHIFNKDKKCFCGREVMARGLCSLHYNRLNLQERTERCLI